MRSQEPERISLREILRIPRPRRELAQTALTDTIEMTPAVIPAELRPLADHIERAKNMTDTEVNDAIKHLDVDLIGLNLYAREAFEDTQEIPPVVSELIDDAANLIVDNFDAQDYDISTLQALTDAYVLTQDTELIEKVEEVVDTNPEIAGLLQDSVKRGIRFAKEHVNEVDGSFNIIAPRIGEPSLDTPVKEASKVYHETTDANEIIPPARREMPQNPDATDEYLTRPWSAADIAKTEKSLQESEAIDPNKTIEQILAEAREHAV